MNENKDHVKQQLEQEVESIYFTKEMQEAVLAKAANHVPIWNRKFTLRIPKSVAAFVMMVMIGSVVMLSNGFTDETQSTETKEQLIHMSTGLFSISELQQLSNYLKNTCSSCMCSCSKTIDLTVSLPL